MGCNRFSVGTEAAFRCDRGYQLVGRNRLHCQWRDGYQQREPEWSSHVPICLPIDPQYADGIPSNPSFNIFYSENSSIMVIIIILSVLACGLMLLISAMLMNRLMKRRRLMRFQRSDGIFGGDNEQVHVSNEGNTAIEAVCPEQNNPTREVNMWSCFSGGSSNYQHMETPAADPNITAIVADQECSPIETSEVLSHHHLFSNDRESLINPPCYDEAVKCSQYSIVMSSSSGASSILKGHKKSKHGSKSSKRNRNTPPTINADSTLCPPLDCLATTELSSQNIGDGSILTDAGHVRSARVHHSRPGESSNTSFLSGSLETMAVSDGTSVTVRTLESGGSNPSIGSMRAQTGSIGDRLLQPAGTSRGPEPEFREADRRPPRRYSPPPSYERATRGCRSHTASPSGTASAPLYVDNLALDRGDQ